MRTILRNSRTIVLMGLPALLLACGESTSPPDALVGNYTAVTMTSTGTSGQRNELLAGSTLVLNLNADGTTTGHFHFVPPDGSPNFEADMAGTWTRNGLTVEFDQAADSFVRDMPFTMTAGPTATWDLVGDETFSGTRLQVTLRKT